MSGERRPNMQRPPSIPLQIQAELKSPAPRGYRHEQMKKLVLPLLGVGLTEEAVFVQFRGMYPADVSDREIHDLISWAISKSPKSCGYGCQIQSHSMGPLTRPTRISVQEAIANVEEWLGDFCCDRSDLWHVSPWQPLENWRRDQLMLSVAFYGKEEFINIVTDFSIEQKGGEQKANPTGAGMTLSRDEWMRYFRDRGVPQSEAGAWIRPNPVKQRGGGKEGAILDDDVTSHRFCLLESDTLPIGLQLS